VPSDRQERGFVGRPGRVLIRPSAFALARAVVQHGARTEKGKGGKLVGADKALDEAELALAGAFKKKSLGDRAVLTAAADRLVKWSNDVIAELDAVRYTREESIRLAQDLAKAASGPVGDPETAQVLMWGVETLRFELRGDKDPKEPAPVKDLFDKLGKDQVIVTRLRTNLPFLPGEPTNVPDPEKDPKAAAKLKADYLKPVSDRVGERLKTFNSFSAPAYRDIFGKLAPALGEFK
jgi:hypothetical protein